MVSGGREGVGDWALGPSHIWGLGDIWELGINKTSSGSGRVPGCTEEGAGLSLRAQRHLQDMRQLHFELKVKQGENSKPHGRKRLGMGWGLCGGLCVERTVPGREAAGGQNTLGEATDLWEQMVGTAVVGETSDVKEGGRGT